MQGFLKTLATFPEAVLGPISYKQQCVGELCQLQENELHDQRFGFGGISLFTG